MPIFSAALGDPRRNNPRGIRAWNLGQGVTATPTATYPAPGAPPLPATASLGPSSVANPGGILAGGGGMSAAPAATGGGVLGTGMTGGQAALAAMSGVASFLGGYQRNAGLLQQSRYMADALAYDIQQQQAKALQAQRASVVQQADQNDRKSLIDTAEKLYKMGDNETANSFMERAETLWKRDNLTLGEKQSQIRPFSIRAIEQKQIIQNFEQTIDDRGGFENLTNADAIGLAMQFQRGEIPGVLSDQEYQRVAGMMSGTQIINVMKDMVGLPPSAPPVEVIKALYQRAYSNAVAADRSLSSMVEFLKIDKRDAQLWTGGRLPVNRIPEPYQLPDLTGAGVEFKIPFAGKFKIGRE